MAKKAKPESGSSNEEPDTPDTPSVAEGAQEPEQKAEEVKQPVAIQAATPSILGSKTTGALEAGPDDPIMMFPKPVRLIHDGIMYSFARGVHRVPKPISTHWYLKHNNVELWKG